ncbi:MAG: stage II sporulation protein M [Candidatus Aramenus sp.]|jgi:hypothetical protein|nr:stage II sporulation protein M [Candidatus Aramenus sp.]
MRPITRLILIFFGIELAIFLGVSAIPVNNPEMAQTFSSTVSSTDSLPYVLLFLTIFSHNLSIALVDFLPVIGIGVLLFSIGSTAYVLTSYTTTVYHIPGVVDAIGLMTLPHSWLELPAYAVAAGAGTYAIWKRDWVRSLLMVPFAALELLLAAMVEAAEISFPSLSYFMWIPGAIAIVGLYFLYEYLQRKADNYQKVGVGNVNAYSSQGYQYPAQYPTYYYPASQPQYANPQLSLQQEVSSMLYRAQIMENQGRIPEAMQAYWDVVVLLVKEASIKSGFMPITLQDFFNTVNLLGQKFYPELPTLFQGAYNSKSHGNFEEFKGYALPLISKLKSILGIS